MDNNTTITLNDNNMNADHQTANNDYSKSNNNNPDFTFQYSPEAYKSQVNQQSTNNINQGIPSEFLGASDMSKHIEGLIHQNKKVFTGYNTNYYSSEINADKSGDMNSTFKIQPFQRSPQESEKNQGCGHQDSSPQIPSERRQQHCIQNYLRMLSIKALKGDDINLESTKSDTTESESRRTDFLSIGSQVKVFTINTTENDIESQNYRLDIEAFSQQNHDIQEIQEKQDSDEKFKLQYSIICRICKKEGLKSQCKEEQIINPCSCQGSNYWVHNTCLEKEIRSNIQYYVDNPSQSICCTTCMTPYSMSIFRSHNWNRYRDVMPCFFIHLALIALMVYFLIMFIQEVTVDEIQIGSALVNFYIFIFIVFVSTLTVFLTLKMLEQYKLRINKYQKNQQGFNDYAELQSTRDIILRFLKQTSAQQL